MSKISEEKSKLAGERFKKAKNIFGLSWKDLLDNNKKGSIADVWDDRTLRKLA
ncbi:MAG: hypothetical protein GY859_26150 [Desulfobacterales bacterium]|nr:hypothetical protein [Desulfobacterales bacterium]